MKTWFIDKLLKVGVPAAIKYGIAFLLAHNANAILSSLGVTVDWSKFQAQITILLGTVIEIAEAHLQDSKSGPDVKAAIGLILIGGLLIGPKPAYAFNLITDIEQQTQWTLGSSVAAGTAVALRHDDASGLAAGQFVGSALAQVGNYRFLSFWAGGNFIKQPDGSLKAIDTAKLGLNFAYLFRGFANQPPDLIKNLVVGPSLTMPIWTTPHVVIPFVDINYAFGGTGAAPISPAPASTPLAP